TQITSEVRLCATAQAFFDKIVDFYTALQSLRQDGLQTVFLGLQGDADAAFNQASAALAQEEAILNTIAAVEGAVLGLASAVTGGLGAVAASIIAAVGSAVANAAWGALSYLATTSPSLDTATEYATSQLETALSTLYTNWLSAFGQMHASVFTD